MGEVISTFLFQPPSPPTQIRLQPASTCSHMELVWLKTSMGSQIPALYLYRKYATFTILYSHGNAEDLGMLCDYLLDLSKILHVNILAYDYTGYGFSNRESTAPVSTPSPIAPTEEHFYSDITAAYKYLVDERQIAPRHVILYGRSIGSGPSCYLASQLNKKKPYTADQALFAESYANSFSFDMSLNRRSITSLTTTPSSMSGDMPLIDSDNVCGIGPHEKDADYNTPDDEYVGGIILHSPFASIYRIVMDFGFTFQYDQFSNIDRIGDVCCPTLLIHGTNDEIVPFAHGKALYKGLPHQHKVFQPFWAQKMGHNNIEVDATNAFVRYLMEFLQTVRQRQLTGEDVRGPSRAQDEKVDLTKTFVQSHVMIMMDKRQRQHSGFLKKSSASGRAGATSPAPRRTSTAGHATTSRTTRGATNARGSFAEDDILELDDLEFVTAKHSEHKIGLAAVTSSTGLKMPRAPPKAVRQRTGRRSSS